MKKTRPTRLKNIKVYEGLFRKANINGMSNDLLFFLDIKSLSKTGVLKNPYEFIMEHTGLSKSSVYSKLRRLEQKGFIQRKKTKYKVNYIEFISYKKLYRKFDLDTEKRNKKGKVSLPIFKINISLMDYNNLEIKDCIFREEIKRNLTRQKFKVFEKLINKIIAHKYGAIKKGTPEYRRLSRQIKKTTSFEKEYNKQLHVLRQNFTLNYDINFDVTLSCFKVSNILGYTSKGTGFNIERYLKDKSLLNIINNRKTFISNNILDYKYYYRYNNTVKGIYIKKNAVYKQLPNKLTVI